MALFHGFGVLPISNLVELLQDCSLCWKEGLIPGKRDCHAASLLVAGEFGWRNRGGGPPME